jgi:CRISPR system Cascade subunit CasD
MPRSLALCLDAPMQSWGLRSRANVRDTAMEPTKSGIVGMLGAALGMARDDQARIAEVAALRMGVRVDREGILERDYHTTQDVPTTTGLGHRTVVSHRDYLADALFLVVLEGTNPTLLVKLDAAVRSPRWPLFLGRRAFVPARPLVASGRLGEPPTGAGLSERSAEEQLATHPWLELRAEVRSAELQKTQRVALRTVIDCAPETPDAGVRYDHPVSFSREGRRYTAREVRIGRVPLTDELISTGEMECI